MTIVTLPSRTVDTDQRFNLVMSSQEVFDQVVYHLGTMPERSVAEINGRQLCLYRTKTGNSCALGRMIKDEEYRPAMEKSSAYTIIIGYADIRERLKIHESLLTSLQQIHDETTNWFENRVRMKENLTYLVHVRAGLDDEMINHPDMIWNKGQ